MEGGKLKYCSWIDCLYLTKNMLILNYENLFFWMFSEPSKCQFLKEHSLLKNQWNVPIKHENPTRMGRMHTVLCASVSVYTNMWIFNSFMHVQLKIEGENSYWTKVWIKDESARKLFFFFCTLLVSRDMKQRLLHRGLQYHLKGLGKKAKQEQ